MPRLAFAYSWIEDTEAGHASFAATLEGRAAEPSLPVIRIAPGFRPPLFYSLGCFAKHVLNGGSCPDVPPRMRSQKGCPRDFTREISQGRNRFQVIVRDCVTYLFAVP
jgi:hypothetical protein